MRVQPASTNDATGLLRLGPGNDGQSEDGIAVRRPAVADVVQIGDAAVFLSSDAGRYITGTILDVDGGSQLGDSSTRDGSQGLA